MTVKDLDDNNILYAVAVQRNYQTEQRRASQSPGDRDEASRIFSSVADKPNYNVRSESGLTFSSGSSSSN